MAQMTAPRANPSAVRLNRIKTYLSKPHNVILLLMGVVLKVHRPGPPEPVATDSSPAYGRPPDHRGPGAAFGTTNTGALQLLLCNTPFSYPISRLSASSSLVRARFSMRDT